MCVKLLFNSVAIDKFAFLILVFILELPVPEFRHKGRTFCNCLLLDRLLVIGGQWEEALQALVVLDYELVIYR